MLQIDAAAEDTPTGPRLVVRWTHDPGAISPDDLDDLTVGFAEALAALVTHVGDDAAGGFTPSDVATLELDQPAIDRIDELHPGGVDGIWALTAAAGRAPLPLVVRPRRPRRLHRPTRPRARGGRRR